MAESVGIKLKKLKKEDPNKKRVRISLSEITLTREKNYNNTFIKPILTKSPDEIYKTNAKNGTHFGNLNLYCSQIKLNPSIVSPLISKEGKLKMNVKMKYKNYSNINFRIPMRSELIGKKEASNKVRIDRNKNFISSPRSSINSLSRNHKFQSYKELRFKIHSTLENYK